MAPALSIELDQNKKIWYGGDIISGKVILQSKDKVDITKDVILVFECLAKLGVNWRYPNPPPVTGYRTRKLYLFEWQDCLCQGPTTLPSGTTSWDFRLPIPRNHSETAPRSEGDDVPMLTGPSDGSWSHEILPPSMNESAHAGECIINYDLKATVRSDKFFTRDKGTTLRLVVHPQTQSPSTVLSPASQSFQVRSRHLNAAGKSGGLKEKMRFALKPSSQPTAEFSLLMELPSYVVHSVNHQGKLSVTHKPQESSGVEAPVINLTWIDITMTQETGVAVTPHTWTAGKPVASWSGRVPLNDSVELGALMKRIMIPESTIPTFHTSVAHVSWKWHFHVMFNCAGKDFDFRGDIPCTILSQPWDEAANASRDKTMQQNFMESLAPPTVKA